MMGRTLTVTPEPFDGMVLTQAWVEGESPDGKIEFELTCGAGLGSTHVKLSVKNTVTGERRVELFEMRGVIEEWVGQIAEELVGDES